MSTTSSSAWFIRSQGRVRGPFTIQKLKQLQAQGRLDHRTELSEDRVTWFKAGSFTELYAPGSVPAEVVRGPQQKEWYYQQSGRRVGPVSFQALQQLVSSGRIVADELVWCEGMPAWSAAHQVPELGLTSGRRPGLAALSKRKKVALAVSALALLLAPAWFVIHLNNERVAEAKRLAEERRQEEIRLAAERAEQQRRDAEQAERVAMRQAIEKLGALAQANARAKRSTSGNQADVQSVSARPESESTVSISAQIKINEPGSYRVRAGFVNDKGEWQKNMYGDLWRETVVTGDEGDIVPVTLNGISRPLFFRHPYTCEIMGKN